MMAQDIQFIKSIGLKVINSKRVSFTMGLKMESMNPHARRIVTPDNNSRDYACPLEI